MWLIPGAAVFWAVQSYAVKRTVQTGIARKDFFYLSCLFLVPFAALMLLVTPVHFSFSLWLLPLLTVAVLLRYGKQTAEAACMETLVPFESEAYMCLGVVLAYGIDATLGIKAVSVWGALSVALALSGVFLMADVRLRASRLRLNLVIRIGCDVGLGLCTRYALQFCSNALFILLLNGLIALLWCRQYPPRVWKEKTRFIKPVLIQQALGFVCLYLGNLAVQQSVTAYAFIRPIALALCICTAFVSKKEARVPKIKDFLAGLLIAAGIGLQLV